VEELGEKLSQDKCVSFPIFYIFTII